MKKIIVVDDHDAIRKGVKLLLDTSGKYKAFEAANGNLALQVIDKENPDLAIVDLMMPEMDGFTLCDEIKKKYPNLPVVILTAKADPETEEKVVHQFKPDKYLVKPIDNQVLLDTVEQILK